MAEIKPLKAWRYNKSLQNKIEELISPLFDVVSDRQRATLYHDKLNSIHLSVPKGEDPSSKAEKTLNLWKKNGTIIQDKIPSIYVYYQYFKLPGYPEQRIRKGFISNIRIYDWDEKIILRHENTMPHSVSDRIDLLRKTELNVSPTHGLYSDESHEIEKYLDESMKSPIYQSEDYQGVRDVFSVIHDAFVISRIVQIIHDKKIILADGHHRYEGSLSFMKERKKHNPSHTGAEGYNFHLMYFTNTESDDFRILPTHRLLKGFEGLSEYKLLKKLSGDFHLKSVDNQQDLCEIIIGKEKVFGLLTPENAYAIKLKENSNLNNTIEFPGILKDLNVYVIHHMILDKVLGIPLEIQVSSNHLKFERNFSECLKEVVKGEAQFAFITNEISIDTVKNICYSGYTLPQKSTYFYPKVITGFLFGSINDEEFKD